MTCYCPNCGKKQTELILGHRGNSSFSWEYEFVCENCSHIITYEDWGYDYSKDQD